MAEKEKKSKIGLVLLLVLFVIGGLFIYWHYFVQPAMAEISALNEEKSKLRSEIDTLRTKLARKPEIEKKWSSISDTESYYYEKIPQWDDLPQVLGALEHLVMTSPLEIESLSVAQFQQGDKGGYIPVSLKARGPAEELLRLLERLEQFKHMSLTDQAIMETVEGDHRLSLDFRLIILPEGQGKPVGPDGEN
ncbi:MAG TPA: hypothetical protein PKV91_01410 [Bacillota bacterium]|nr:hypothetical protein [Bacillota bacterium]HOJ85159.1 hypothetical protein [Bacillota bacterium]HOL16222.1 hypothetical protein [Bacillota bacterium]HPU00483.1 hypothetical protein [Bacillota bacterium]HPZ10994.1 hypothetical protein [Bacillota bacterium]